MKYGRIIQKPRVKFIEVADGVFAGISPYRGISWANAGFINKGDGLVYDTFFDLFHAREMREAFMEVSNGGSPAYVVNSHYNSDHAWGNKVFEDACIIMHKEASRERLTENIAWMDSVIRRGKNSSESTPGERFFAAEFEGFDLEGVEWVLPNIEIKDDINIRLGDTEVMIHNVAPAHSDSDLLLWMPKEKCCSLAMSCLMVVRHTAKREPSIGLKCLIALLMKLNPKSLFQGMAPFAAWIS